MDDLAALKLALELVRVPSRIPHARSTPLPGGVALVLRIASGDAQAASTASASTHRPKAELGEAAAFFIEQVLLAPDADQYRVLGVRPSDSLADIRRNMALLLKWLHPDVQPERERSVFARRVARAWDDLKTAERRAAYDEAQRKVKSRRVTAGATPGKRPISTPSNRHAPAGRQGANFAPESATSYHRHGLRSVWRRARLYFLGGAEP